MIHRKDPMGVEGLQFFGKISASISHELKNGFAVINENAGLFEDFSVMAEKGMPLDPARLMKLAGTIRKHIRRVDGIVNRMNRFAHSVDEPVKKIDLRQMTELLVSLAHRFAVLKEVTIDVHDPKWAVFVTTAPFVLENLVWRCIDVALDAVGGDKRLVFCTEAAEAGALLRFSHLGRLSEIDPKRFPSEIDATLAARLNAGLDAYPDAGEIVITLPDDIGGSFE